jgi:hypothetical protein
MAAQNKLLSPIFVKTKIFHHYETIFKSQKHS